MNSSDQDGDLKIGVAESLLDLAFNGAIPSIFRMHVVRERLISGCCIEQERMQDSFTDTKSPLGQC